MVSACANIQPPPDRQHWDDVPVHTQCTDTRSGVHGQSAASLLYSGLGGLDIGAGIALGYVPVIGIGLVSLGLFGAVDADQKLSEIRKCEEFKEYVRIQRE